MRMSCSQCPLAGGCACAASGHLFVAYQCNNRIREAPIPGPALGLNNVTTNNACIVRRSCRPVRRVGTPCQGARSRPKTNVSASRCYRAGADVSAKRPYRVGG
jgi:hypothetical protein